MYKFDYKFQENTQLSPGRSLLIFILFLFSSVFAGELIVSLVVYMPNVGFDMARFQNMVQHPELVMGNNSLALAVQGVFMLVMFVATPILYLHFIQKKDISYLSHPKTLNSFNPIFFIIGIGLIFMIYPLSLKIREFTALGMESGFFGAFGSKMANYELSQQESIKALLTIQSQSQIIWIILVIAVLPALGEELVFRGVFQNIFIKMNLPVGISVLLTAFVFSALHFSLTDFVPRLLLGAVLGFSYYYSKNFWVPVFLHCMNNALSIWYYFALENKSVTYNMESQGAILWSVVLVSTAFFAILFVWLIKNSAKEFGDEDSKVKN